MVGPYRGGRVTAVTGYPEETETYLMGSVGGGVWKTTNAPHQIGLRLLRIPRYGGHPAAPIRPNHAILHFLIQGWVVHDVLVASQFGPRVLGGGRDSNEAEGEEKEQEALLSHGDVLEG